VSRLGEVAFDVVAGTVRPEEFFAPENIGRIVAAPVPA